jgi:UTP--glucose-1-phosphate uridylyltransferase
VNFGEYRALITAGGVGTRLLPFSKEMPKEMFPIFTFGENGSIELKPLIQAIFEQLHGIGVRSFYIVVGRGKRAIEDHFSSDPAFLEFLNRKGKLPSNLVEFYEKIKSSNLVYLNQPEPLGFGDAVQLGRPVINGTFIVQAGDTFILSDGNKYLYELAAMHRKYKASATVLLQDVDDPRQYGVVDGEYLEEGVLKMKSATEKPEDPITNHAIMPVYIFENEIFDALAEVGPGKYGELQLTDAIQHLISNGKRVMGVNLGSDELRLDLGTPETMVEALKLSLNHVEAKKKEYASSVKQEIPPIPALVD